MRGLLAILIVLANGCTLPDGSRCQAIIGFGWVRVAATNETTVTRVQACGLAAGPQGVTLGFARTLTTAIPTNANVLLEIRP